MAYRYPTVKINGKTKLKHRHIVEQSIGRVLDRSEHVHHRDHDPWNPALDNLQVKPASVHLQEHADERAIYPREKDCVICGGRFTPHPTKRKRQRTCSPTCANALRSKTEHETKSKSKATVCPDVAEALVHANLATGE
jgi:HNH endonuclease